MRPVPSGAPPHSAPAPFTPPPFSALTSTASTFGVFVENRDLPAATARAAAAAAPTLSSVTPSMGPAAGGNIVTLHGTGFSVATAVNFGNRAAPGFSTTSPTQIQAVAPSGTGTVQVTVRSPLGTSNSRSYIYVPAPVLAGISPSQGPAAGGTTVTLTGTGLAGAVSVDFGATSAAFTVDSPTQITAVTPPGTSAVPVTVTTPGGASAPVYFFYLDVPALHSLSPLQGPLAAGTAVALTGAGLGSTTAVWFGSESASFSVESSTRVTAIAPAGTTPGPVPVTATTPGGTSNPLSFTYLAPPVLTELSPEQGPVYGGTTVTLTGSGLTTTATVLFDSAPAAFSVESDALVVANAPAGAAGPVLVTVTTPGGVSNSLPFTRQPSPEI